MTEKTFIQIDDDYNDDRELISSKTIESRGSYGNNLMYHIALDEETGIYHGKIGKVLESFTWDNYNEEEVTNILRKHYYAIKNGEE